MTVTRVDAVSLHAMLKLGSEIAVLDVREKDAYENGHLLLAVNTPPDGLEHLVRGYVPRVSTHIVLCDGDDGLAERAADRLAALGYGELVVLAGGAWVWAAAGYELFETSYAVANCFGLAVQERYGTPRINGLELTARLAAGDPLVIVDSRPFDEYHAATVPGAINVPTAELVHRIDDLLPDDKTTVVVHCGGKTRGILGCQTLINAGLKNPVVALDEGTGDWVMAGGTLEAGASRTAVPGSVTARAGALQAAKRIAERFGVRSMEPEELDVWRGEAERRTPYLVDVRSPEEYEAGHLPDSRSIPGGQLSGCTEDYVATRNARLCLVDDDGARAIVTASWMLQQGWPEVAVLAGGVEGHDLVSGPDPFSSPHEPADDPTAADEPPDQTAEIAACRQSYVWRQGLLERFDRDRTLSFVLQSA